MRVDRHLWRFRLEALHAGPRLHQRAVNREVLARQKLLDFRLIENRRKELGRNIAFEQPVPVLGEHRVIPDRIVDAQAHKPAEQKVELQPLHQLAFRADRIEACNSEARSSFSGGIEGRPSGAYIAANAPSKSDNAAFTISGSPEADDLSAPASPDRHTRTACLISRQNHACKSPRHGIVRESFRPRFRYRFFNSLLGAFSKQPCQVGLWQMWLLRMLSRRFFDPLYGVVLISDEDAALIFSAEIQRLRYVRMCNINSLLISGASEPSRFEHVIGVLHLAKAWTAINRLNGEEARIVQSAALLHDFQTGPFGHSFEYILDDNQLVSGFRHDDVRAGAELRYLQSTNYNVAFSGVRFSSQKALGDLWPRVAEAIAGRGPFGPIIAGTIDLDNIDNVVRLAYHVGVARGEDAEICLGLARDLRLDGGTLSVSQIGLELVSRWQAIRQALYALLLHDWAEFSAKAMLTSMMELAVSYQLLRTRQLAPYRQ